MMIANLLFRHSYRRFRQACRAPLDAQASRLRRILRDDGVAVHLNGSEIYRANLAQSALPSAPRAAYDVANADESGSRRRFTSVASAPATAFTSPNHHRSASRW